MPSRAQVAQVFAVIVLMVYSWTILWFFYKLPSWLYFLDVGEITTVFAYSLATNLAESIAVLCGPVALSLILPRKWFHDVFVARGGTLAIAGLAYMMYVAFQFKSKDDYPSLTLKPSSLVLVLVLIVVLVYLAGRSHLLRRIVETVADRATIFLYVYMPLSLLALLVVLFHWIT
jgi:hypothetical protein